MTVSLTKPSAEKVSAVLWNFDKSNAGNTKNPKKVSVRFRKSIMPLVNLYCIWKTSNQTLGIYCSLIYVPQKHFRCMYYVSIFIAYHFYNTKMQKWHMQIIYGKNSHNTLPFMQWCKYVNVQWNVNRDVLHVHCHAVSYSKHSTHHVHRDAT